MESWNSHDGIGTGHFWVHVPDGQMTGHRALVASVCELNAQTGFPQPGDAVFTMHNAVPMPGEALFHISILRDAINPWPNPLHYRIFFHYT
ncbi:hypothetical protein ACFQ6N_17300 [Kitasatospora sp. NPDC056446]|uniref:hypothetical protein n=1 Tax=Kitasatospora sp. NPDC056446 TaxID=3345819 RepID=UPI0036A123AC